MAKKVKHFPSDFSKPKPKPFGEKKELDKTTQNPLKKTAKKKVPKAIVKPKKQRKSKRAFLAEEEKKLNIEKKVIEPKTDRQQKIKQSIQDSKILKKQKPLLRKKKKNIETKKDTFPENANPYFQSEIKIPKKKKEDDERISKQEMPLNKFVAHAGICSRRDAIELIKKGKIIVNSVIELNPAVKVSDNDEVIYEDKRLSTKKDLVYYLLNKPKNFITTHEDPEKRNTVFDLFKNIDTSRLHYVGRLDRNTTGLLLIMNDGELAQKLAHPQYNVKKVYQVSLDKALTRKDFEKIVNGLVLEDGIAPVDEIAYINPKDKKEIGIQIHSGKNRIVRRIFEHLEYQVKALDRVVYAGLNKKNIPRGTYRLLDEKEIRYLKHFK